MFIKPQLSLCIYPSLCFCSHLPSLTPNALTCPCSHITLVPGSPPTSAVPSFTRFWLQPFSHYAVTSLGALSQRWPAGTAPPPSTSTGEGHAVRCFSRFIMCKITLKKPTGAFYTAGQYVANYYMVGRRVGERALHCEWGRGNRDEADG